MDYFVLNAEDLDSISRDVDVPYYELESQLRDAKSMKGFCVYFRRYKAWHWVVVDERIPIDWFMALILA